MKPEGSEVELVAGEVPASYKALYKMSQNLKPRDDCTDGVCDIEYTLRNTGVRVLLLVLFFL